MSSTTGCRYCQGLSSGTVSRCHHCGTMVRRDHNYTDQLNAGLRRPAAIYRQGSLISA